MDIKPIETQYKGYRFRSRLEARWAVFFDALGVEWEYEKEGFEKDGVRYLPDFFIPCSRNFSVDNYIEIKPFSKHIPFRQIYLAGKINDDDWRTGVIESLRDKFERFNVSGPRHYMSHDETEINIVEYCLGEVNSSDIVFANFNTTKTVGTIFELGYAHAKGKTICANFATKKIRDELWFVCELLDNFTIGGDVIAPLGKYLTPLSDTFKKCRIIAGHNRRSILFQGDPGNCNISIFGTWDERDWGSNNIKRFCELFFDANPFDVDDAISKSRGARFEFGEQG